MSSVETNGYKHRVQTRKNIQDKCRDKEMKKSLGSLLVALAPVLGLASEAGAACKVTGVNVTDGMLTVTGEGLERRGRIPQVFVDGIEIFPVFSLLTTIEAPLPELNLVGTTVKLLSIKRTPRDRGCDDLFINLHAPDLLFTSPDGIAELTAATTRADEADAAAATRGERSRCGGGVRANRVGDRAGGSFKPEAYRGGRCPYLC